MSVGIENIADWLSLGGALLTVGVTLGALPRFAHDLDEHKKSTRAELDKVWEHSKECTADRRQLSEKLSGMRRQNGGHA